MLQWMMPCFILIHGMTSLAVERDFIQQTKTLKSFDSEKCLVDLSKNSWVALQSPKATRSLAVRPQNLRGFLPHPGLRPKIIRDGPVLFFSSVEPPLDEIKAQVDCAQKALKLKIGLGESFHGWHLDLITGQVLKADLSWFSSDLKFLATLEFFEVPRKPEIGIHDCRPRKDFQPCRRQLEFQTSFPPSESSFEELEGQWTEAGFQLKARWSEAGNAKSSRIECLIKNGEVQTCR